VIERNQRNAEPVSKGTPASLRLLSEEQYLNTLSYVFGPNMKPTTRFAALPRTDGLLASGAAMAGLTDTQLEMYQKTAAKVAKQIIGEDSRNYLIPCTPVKPDAADADCARAFITATAPLLYRRALTPSASIRWSTRRTRRPMRCTVSTTASAWSSKACC
jgi:hypothetical protein